MGGMKGSRLEGWRSYLNRLGGWVGLLLIGVGGQCRRKKAIPLASSSMAGARFLGNPRRGCGGREMDHVRVHTDPSRSRAQPFTWRRPFYASAILK